jgi:hypothetical protein
MLSAAGPAGQTDFDASATERHDLLKTSLSG